MKPNPELIKLIFLAMAAYSLRLGIGFLYLMFVVLLATLCL